MIPQQLGARLKSAHSVAIVFGIIFACLAAIVSSSVIAQETEDVLQLDPGPTAENTRPIDTDLVVVDGEELFLVRGSSALPASERAGTIIDRIVAAAEASDQASVQVEIRPGEFGPTIYADENMIMVTTVADAEFEQVGLDNLAFLRAKAVEEAILSYRQSRSGEARMDTALEVLLWTVLFVVCSGGLFWLNRYFALRIETVMVKHLAGVEEATKAIVQTRPLAAMAGMALRLALSGVFLILLYYYLTVVLYAFAETKPLAELLLNYVTGPIFVILSTIAGYIPNLVALIIIAFITRYLIRVARVVFQNIEAGHFQIAGFEEQWIWPTFNITRGMIIILALVLAFPYIPGSNSAAFRGLTILLGVMVSLGSNAVVGNLLAGLFAIYRRSTNIGDRIKVGDLEGDVVAIKLMETHLKSLKNELISIPNSKLLNSEVINYSSEVDRRGLLVHSTVGIGYEEPQMKIEKMLIEAARRTKDLKKSPPPFVLRTGLVDYAVNYQINAYTKHGSHLPKIRSDLNSSILDVFNENQVQIMTPSYIADPEAPKIAPVTETPITMSGENKGANS